MDSLGSQGRTPVHRAAVASERLLKALIVIDGSERTGRVIAHTLNVAQDVRSIEVVLLVVVAAPTDGRLRGYGTFKRDQHAHFNEALGERAVTAAARRFDQAGVSHKERIEIGDPADTILRVAEEESCDLILLGDAPPGALRRWLPKVTGLSIATVASQVAQLAPIPVLVLK